MNNVFRGGPILAFNPGHDGAVIVLEDQRLGYSIEAEHDSMPRHLAATAHHLLEIMAKMISFPATIATSGWNHDGIFRWSMRSSYEGVSADCIRTEMINL